MKTKILITNCLLVMFVSLSFAQQTSVNNQYGSVTIPVNSATSFLRANGEVNFVGRQQWVGLDGAPEVYGFALALPVGKKGLMAGANLSYGTMSVERLSEATLFIGKSLQFNNSNNLAVAIGAGLGHHRANFSELDTSDPLFARNESKSSGHLNLSVLWHHQKGYFAGISVPKLALSKMGIGGDNRRELYNQYNLLAGRLIGLNDDFDVKPVGLLAWSKDVGVQADFSTMLYLKKMFGLGANLRSYGGVAAMGQCYVNQFSFGYSYQFNNNTRNFRGMGGNTHEINIGFRLGEIAGNYF